MRAASLHTPCREQVDLKLGQQAAGLPVSLVEIEWPSHELNWWPAGGRLAGRGAQGARGPPRRRARLGGGGGLGGSCDVGGPGPLSPRGASLHTRRREQALWEADQLRHSQRAGDVLARFSEGQYSFPPTFKVLRQRGAHYKQQRIPSYCDRILWRSMPGRGSSAVTQTSLAAVPGALPPARTLAPAAKPRQCRSCEQASPPRTTSPSSPLSRWPLRRGCTAPPAPESRRGEGSASR